MQICPWLKPSLARLGSVALACAGMMLGGVAHASPPLGVSFDLINNGAGNFDYHYILNNTGPAAVSDVLIYFPDVTTPVNFAYTLNSGTSPAGWSVSLIQPSAINLGGYAEWTGTLGAGSSLSGFGVNFNYSDTASLGSQYFEVYDWDFVVTDSGWTQPAEHGVPDSANTAACLVGALLALACVRRRLVR